MNENLELGYPNLMCFGRDLPNCLLLDSCPKYKECEYEYRRSWLELFEMDVGD